MKALLSILKSIFLVAVLCSCQAQLTSTQDPAPRPKSPPPPTSGDEIATAAQLRLGDRYFMISFFKSVFGENAKTSFIEGTIIQSNKSEFGHGCEKFGPESEACGRRRDESLLSMISPITSSREALRLKACYHALASTSSSPTNSPGLIQAIALTKNIPTSVINPSSIQPPTETELQGAYQLFFPAQTAPQAVIDGLEQLSAAVAQNEGNLEAWRMMLLALCTSPAWQVP